MTWHFQIWVWLLKVTHLQTTKTEINSFLEYARLINAVDAVYHCAGNVNVILPYDVLKKTNVTGTRNIIDFCTTGASKRLHYVSTLSVFTSTNTSKRTINETDFITSDTATKVYGGYAASKWVGEYLVESAIKQGLQVGALTRL